MTLGGRPNRQAINGMLGQAVQLQQAGRHEEAARLYRNVLLHDPRNFDATHLLGVATVAMGDAERALSLLQRAVELDPRAAEAWNHLGNVLKFLVRPDEAMAAYRKAVDLNPKLLTALSNLALLQGQTGDHETAIQSFELLLAKAPDRLPALLSIADLYQRQGNHAAARARYERVLDLEPANPLALIGRLDIDAAEANWSHRQRDVAAVFAFGQQHGHLLAPMYYLWLTDDPKVHLAAARLHSANGPKFGQPFPPRPVHDRQRLRLAYLSTDFREHPVAYLIPELIERHDRERFEVVAYSAGTDDGSAFRRRLEAGFDRFEVVKELDPLALGRRLYDDEIDILIDLNGHTASTRMPILQLRPAPLQISWLGYPATIGAPYIDYAFVDRFLVPDGKDANFSEALVLLPDTFQVNDRKRPVAPDAPTRRHYGLPDDPFVFCCFNNAYKINPEVFDAWINILREVPNSVLWLYAKIDPVRINLLEEAKTRGIDPARLIFSPRDPYPTYLARYRHADLVLDTWPYNAGTTASDALWMGAPVLTLAQRSMTSRMAGSFLTALDLPEMITTSVDEYVDTAVRLAREPARLADVKARLAYNRDHGRFFDTDRFRRHMEAALLTMWERYKAGLPPQSFAVPTIS